MCFLCVLLYLHIIYYNIRPCISVCVCVVWICVTFVTHICMWGRMCHLEMCLL